MANEVKPKQQVLTEEEIRNKGSELFQGITSMILLQQSKTGDVASQLRDVTAQIQVLQKEIIDTKTLLQTQENSLNLRVVEIMQKVETSLQNVTLKHMEKETAMAKSINDLHEKLKALGQILLK